MPRLRASRDRAGVAEMLRVLRPGGRLAVAVWDTLEDTPGYAAAAGMLERLFGIDDAQLERLLAEAERALEFPETAPISSPRRGTRGARRGAGEEATC